MSSSFFATQKAAIVDAYAAAMGCEPRDFSREEYTVIDRPEPPAWPFSVGIVTFGTGTVVSVLSEYREFVASIPPERHFEALNPPFFEQFRSEADRRGERASASGFALGLALARFPEKAPAPPGYNFEIRDAAWMNENMGNLPFERGLGRPGISGREVRNRFAVVMHNADGGIAGIAGAFNSYGLLEIGIDVARSERGKGLSVPLIRAASRAILDEGAVPFYGVGPGNIRSQHTALAAGYEPVLSDGFFFLERAE